MMNFVFACACDCAAGKTGHTMMRNGAAVSAPFRPAPGGLRMGRFRVRLRPRKRPGTHSLEEFSLARAPRPLRHE